MKKIISATLSLAIMTFLCISCQKGLNNEQETVGNREFTITAHIADNSTKVSYSEKKSTHVLKPSWQKGDVIIGFDSTGNTYGYSVIDVDNITGRATLAIITSGDYKGSKIENPDNGTLMYMFYAPGKKPGDINTNEKSLTVNISSQSKDSIPALMTASAEVADNSLSLAFHNQTAIIGIKTPTMAQANKKFTSVTLSGTGINTEIKFRLNGETLLPAYQGPGSIRKNVEFTSDASGLGPDVIYIAVCPLSPASNLTFMFNGNEEYFTVENAKMEVGKYYYILPTSTRKTFDIGGSAPPTDMSEEIIEL